MTRIRVGLIITAILGVIYAAAGLLSNLTDFGIGVAVVAAAITLHGLVHYIETHESARAQQYRDRVWARRDAE